MLSQVFKYLNVINDYLRAERESKAINDQITAVNKTKDVAQINEIKRKHSYESRH